MARIRTIKPETWTDETFARLSPMARLLYIGCWNLADDDGRLRWGVPTVRAVLGYDELTVLDCKRLLDEIEDAGRVLVYDVGSDRYAVIRSWRRHQVINRPTPSRLPPPPGDEHTAASDGADTAAVSSGAPHIAAGQGPTHGVLSEDSVSTHGVLSEDSVSTHCPEVGSRNRGREERPDGLSSTGDSARAEVAVRRDDVDRLCEHLADLVEANGSRRPTVTRKWREACRLMLDRDGLTEAQVRAAIDWCQADEFWRGNVLSMPTLRVRFDQLRLHAQRGPTGRASPHRTGDARLAANLAVVEEIAAAERAGTVVPLPRRGEGP